MVTVVLPTYNAGPHFAQLLDSLQGQTLAPAQIIVVDSHSTDKTPDLASSHGCKVVPIDRADFDHGTTRNLAAAQVSTEFVVFLTQDAIPADEHMIAELIKPMQADPNIAISYGRQLPRPNAQPLERFPDRKARRGSAGFRRRVARSRGPRWAVDSALLASSSGYRPR